MWLKNHFSPCDSLVFRPMSVFSTHHESIYHGWKVQVAQSKSLRVLEVGQGLEVQDQNRRNCFPSWKVVVGQKILLLFSIARNKNFKIFVLIHDHLPPRKFPIGLIPSQGVFKPSDIWRFASGWSFGEGGRVSVYEWSWWGMLLIKPSQISKNSKMFVRNHAHLPLLRISFVFMLVQRADIQIHVSWPDRTS